MKLMINAVHEFQHDQGCNLSIFIIEQQKQCKTWTVLRDTTVVVSDIFENIFINIGNIDTYFKFRRFYNQFVLNLFIQSLTGL